MIRAEVRCCCHPEKLLGTIEMPEHMLVRGKPINVAVSIARTMGKKIRHPFVRFEVAEVTDHHEFTSEFMDAVERGEIKGFEQFIRNGTRLALKKPHDVTIEDLRMLTGFSEAK
jgi:hypothetical protein